MIFKYNEFECDVEIFTNEKGFVVQFFNKVREPKEGHIVDYVYVDAGYGYITLKRIGDDGILSGLLKKEFFINNSMINAAIDFVTDLLPGLDNAYIPYNLERIVVSDAMIWTGETFEDIKNE